MTIDDARRVAEEQRARRDALIDAVAHGEIRPDALVDDLRAADVKVVVIAQVVPGLGKVAARRIMADLRIAEAARWGDLAPGEQRDLVRALTDAGAPPAAGP